MSTIYRRVKRGGLLRVGDEIFTNNGKGWVFGLVKDIDLETGEIEVTPTTQPMLSVEAAKKEANRTTRIAGYDDRSEGISIARALLESQDVQIEDHDDRPWPSVDRTERRRLDDYDPLARAIVKRLYPGDTQQYRPVWVTTVFMTGGYSEYTQEQEYGLTIECGNYIVSIGHHGESTLPLNALLNWLDGKDCYAEIERKVKA